MPVRVVRLGSHARRMKDCVSARCAGARAGCRRRNSHRKTGTTSGCRAVAKRSHRQARAERRRRRRKWKIFARRYAKEMSAPTAGRLLELLAALSRETNISVGCYCGRRSALPPLGPARAAQGARREASLNPCPPSLSRGRQPGADHEPEQKYAGSATSVVSR